MSRKATWTLIGVSKVAWAAYVALASAVLASPFAMIGVYIATV